MQLRWSHAFVHVRSMATMLDFYTNTLGFEITDQGDVGGTRVAFLSQVETDHHQLAFMEGQDGAEQDAPGRVAHFAFRVASLQDVKTLHERLQADSRVEGISPISHGNAWSVYFKDPERNGIEVFCDTPWHVPQPQGEGWDPAASDEDIRRATRAAFAATEGFGAIADFYRERASHLAERADEGERT